MSSISKQPDKHDGLDFTDKRYPNVRLHIELPSEMDSKTTQSVKDLANYVAREVFANPPKKPSQVIYLQITRDLITPKPNEKHALEVDSKLWMATICQRLISQIKQIDDTAKPPLKTIDLAKAKLSINDKEFFALLKKVAHIHGDHFIESSRLEGCSSFILLPYALNVLEKKRISLQTAGSPQSTIWINALTFLIDRIKRGLEVGAIDKKTQIEDKVLIIQKIIKSLKPSEGFLLPGGWVNFPFGHGMYYEITKHLDNTFSMRVFNTGEGIEYHKGVEIFLPHEPGRKPQYIKKYSPFLEIQNINSERIINPHFWTAALEMKTHTSIVQPFFHRKNARDKEFTNYSAVDIYDKLLPVLNGKVIEPSNEDTAFFIAPQSSGTCAWTGIRAFIITYLPSQLFAQLEHEYKGDSLLELYTILNSPEKLARHETGRNLLLKSSKYFANSLLEDYPSAITLDAYTKSQDLVQRIQSSIYESTLIAEQELEKQVGSIEYSSISQLYSPLPPRILSITHADRKLSSDLQNKMVCTAIWDTDWTPHPSTIDQYLIGFAKLYSENLNNYPETTAMCIRELMYKLPSAIDEQFWNQLAVDKINSFIASFTRICELFLKANRKHSVDPKTIKGSTFLLCLYKAQSILHKLLKRLPEIKQLKLDNLQLNSFEFSTFTEAKFFDATASQCLRELLPYQSNMISLFDKPFFLFNNLGSSEKATPDSKIEYNDANVCYQYFIQNREQFAKSLEKEFLEKTPGLDPKNTIIDFDEARATFAMTDLKGRFLPASYCYVKRLALQIRCYQNNCEVVDSTNFIQFRMTQEKQFGLKMPPQMAVNLIFKSMPLHPQTDFPLAYTSFRNYSICSENQKAIFLKQVLHENRLSFIEKMNIMSLCYIYEPSPLVGSSVTNELRILKFIDYYKLHIHLFNTPERQLLFWDLLIEDNNLIELLKKNSEHANSLISFIQEGYTFFQDRKDICGAVFFIFLYQIIFEKFLTLKDRPNIQLASERFSKEGINPTRNCSIHQNLESLLKDCTSMEDKFLVHRQMLFQSYLDFPTINKKILTEILPNVIASLIFIHSVPSPEIYQNGFLNDQIDRLRTIHLPQHLIRAVTNNAFLTHVAKLAISYLGLNDKSISWDKIKWSIPGSICEGKIDGKLIISLNLSDFTILIESSSLGQIPKALLSHPDVLKALPPMENQYVKIKPDALYEFSDAAGCSIRIKCLPGNTLIIERQFPKRETFYQLQKEEVLTTLTSSAYLKNTKICWKSCLDHECALTSFNSNEITHRIIPHPNIPNVSILVDCNNPKLRLLECGQSNNWQLPYQGLREFEDPFYIHAWVDYTNERNNKIKNETVKIEMPRLSLTFNRLFPSQPYATSVEFKGYRIADHQYVKMLGDFRSYLVLTNEKEKKIKVIIPFREALGIDRGGLRSWLFLNHNPSKNQVHPLYFEYVLDKKGDLVALREGGNLFLAYIFFGEGRYNDAQVYLREKSKKLIKYTESELQILVWMQTLHRETRDNDPKACAVLLTAGALIGKNQQLQEQCLNSSNLIGSAYIYNSYFTYLASLNLLEDLILTKEEELVIIKELLETRSNNKFLIQRLQHHLMPETAVLEDKVMHFESVILMKSLGSPQRKRKEEFDARLDRMYDDLDKHIQFEVLGTIRGTKINKIFTPPPSDLLTRRELFQDMFNHLPTFNLQNEYTKAKNASDSDRLSQSMRFALLSFFGSSNNSDSGCFGFLAAVAYEPNKFPSWENFLKLFDDKVHRYSEKQKNIDPMIMMAQKIFTDAFLTLPKEISIASQADNKTQFEITPTPLTRIEVDQKELHSTSLYTLNLHLSSSSDKKIQFENTPTQTARTLYDLKEIVATTVSTLKPIPIPQDISTARLKVSQEAFEYLFVEFGTEQKTKYLQSLAEDLIKECAMLPDLYSANNNMFPKILAERAHKEMIDNIHTFSQTPSLHSYKLKEHHLESPKESCLKIYQQLSKKRKESQHATSLLKNQILRLVNSTILPDHPLPFQREMNAKYKSELLSGLKKQLTIQDLCFAFLRNNPTELIAHNPHISQSRLDDVHKMFISYLIQTSEDNTLQRQENALNEVIKLLDTKPSGPTAVSRLNDLIEIAITELKFIRTADNLPSLIFEWATGFGLRQDQVKNIAKLTDTDDGIFQMNMGDGKSKIYLPIVALTKADGNNMVIIVIPQNLFEQQKNDLKITIREVFNRPVHTLPYNRSTEFSVKKLQNILTFFNEIIKKRECLIMTPQHLACFELKFKEAIDLYVNNPKTPELLQKINLLKDILMIFKTRSKAILDEADTILKSLYEVNFTAGELKGLEEMRCQIVASIYEELVKPEFHNQIQFNPLENFNISLSAYQKEFKPLLLQNILKSAVANPKNLFGTYWKSLDNNLHNKLTSYLEGVSSPEAEKFVEDSPYRDIFALLKAELNSILPLTLNKRYCVDYGPSTKKTKSALSSLSIPYRGNNTPVHSSEFISPEVLMNYTLQMLWKSGVTETEVKQWVLRLRNEAENEMLEKGLTDITKTNSYLDFHNLCGNKLQVRFQKLEESDFPLLKVAANNLRTTAPSLFFELIVKYVFSQIKNFNLQMTSNAITLVDMLKSVIGLTGTPWIAITLHDRLKDNVFTTPAADGKTLVLLYEQCKKLPDNIRTLKAKKYPEILSELIRIEDDVLIDTGALFNGLSNEGIAKDILKHLKSINSKKTGVIFFKNDHAMVLESLEKEGHYQEIPLAHSSLKSDKGELFTYYDQLHSMGTDIPQHQLAKGTLTIGKDVTVRDLAQGAWRLRGLAKLQTVSLAIANEISDHICRMSNVVDLKKISFAHVLKYASHNQTDQLHLLLKLSIKQQIDGVISQAAIQAMLNSKNEEDYHTLASQVHPILLSALDHTPFSLYGNPETLASTKQVVHKIKEEALKKISCINENSPFFKPLTKEAFIKNIESKIDQVLELLKLLPEHSSSNFAGQNNGTAVKQQQKEAMLQSEQLQHVHLYIIEDPVVREWWPNYLLPNPLNANIKEASSVKMSAKSASGDKEMSAKNSADIKEISAKCPPDLLAASTYAFTDFTKRKDIHDKINIFSVKQVFEEKPLLKKFSKFFITIGITENRFLKPNFDIHRKDLVPNYILFIKQKAANDMNLILLDSIQDAAFFWQALYMQCNDLYPKGKNEVELCLSNLNGEIRHHTSTINIKDANNPFMVAFKSQAASLLAQAKLALGELSYTSDELLVIQSIIKECGAKLILEYFEEHIIPNSTEKQLHFKNSQIYKFLTKQIEPSNGSSRSVIALS